MVGERETGNETYTVNLLRGLAEQGSAEEYLLLTPRPERLKEIVDLSPRFHAVKVWPAQSLVRIPLSTPLVTWRRRADLVHMTTYIAPPWPGRPTVVTIHDLSFLEYPNAFSWRVRTMLRTLVPGSVARAARVIAVSEWTKQDLIKRYRVPEEKIVITKEAPAPEFKQLSDASQSVLPEGVREPFVLAVGNLEPRKNLGRLIEAFGVLVSQRGFSGSLVLVGKSDARSGPVLRMVKDSGLETRIVFTGFVSQSTLTLLYNQAALFVYPSLYEGFGLPPLEAMACGCPVVASNVTALPETLGDAALLVDPLSISAMAEAMASVLEGAPLARALREKGLKHASRYSWKQTAAQTLEVYTDVLSRRKAGAGVVTP